MKRLFLITPCPKQEQMTRTGSGVSEAQEELNGLAEWGQVKRLRETRLERAAGRPGPERIDWALPSSADLSSEQLSSC